MTDSKRLLGQWRLIRYSEVAPSGETVDVLGPGAKGRLAYFPDGRMMVMVTGDQRPRLSGAWAAIPVEQKAVAYDRLIAYAGRYSDQGTRVIHHVELCWIPNWEEKDLERLVIPQGENRMILRTPPARSGRTDPVQDLLWERIGPSDRTGGG